MAADQRGSSGRVAIAVGSLGVFALAVLAGIGGPPSEFRSGVPPFVDFLGDHILEIYAAAALVAFAGLVLSLVAPNAGRLTSTAGSLMTMFGNAVSFAIGTSGEGRAALVFVGLSAPFLFLMWAPKLVSKSIRRHSNKPESPGLG
jgi:hypothetical protein